MFHIMYKQLKLISQLKHCGNVQLIIEVAKKQIKNI